MTDRFSKPERSAIMRSVKGNNTSIERQVRSALHCRGLRFRLGYPLPGKPDIVFVRARLAVFIDSCFWHGCTLHLRMPQSNIAYWQRKIQRNIDRDATVSEAYNGSEWSILRLWEHDLRNNFECCIAMIEATVRT